VRVTRVVVAGALAAKSSNGGEAWVRLSYVLGLRRLGCDVSFVEELAAPRAEAVAWFRAVVQRFGLDAALVRPDGSAVVGEPFEAADLVVNVSGNLRNPRLLARARRRAYVDLDPGFTQFWHAHGLVDLEGHDVYFTVGQNVGRRGCTIPVDGMRWLPTRPPVVLDEWPALPRQSDRFTTIASWRGAYGPVEANGKRYGIKAHEFRKLAELPRRAAGRFELALAIDAADDADRDLLTRNGWQLVDPREVAGDADAFRSYVQGSGAEISAAQGIYVETRSGWISDRSARYLASGRPVVVQDTGLAPHVPLGDGVVSFSSLSGAAAAVERVARDYDRHAGAARALAEEWLDSDVVLAELLEAAL
jgi:hypothetical protein